MDKLALSENPQRFLASKLGRGTKYGGSSRGSGGVQEGLRRLQEGARQVRV